jgi:peptide/nickel transport system permease protein
VTLEKTKNPSRINIVNIFNKVGKYPVIPIILLLPILIFGIFGEFIYPHNPTEMSLENALVPPAFIHGGNPAYFLGTDKLGRDLFSRLIQGARASLLVSLCGVFLAGIIGVTLGMLAGFFRGKLDMIIMRIVDTWMSIPGILLFILLAAVMKPGIGTIIISITVVFWVAYARIVRGEVMSVTQREYVTLAKITGCSNFRIMTKHILPNIINTIVVVATLQVGMAILMEAAITFLGLGIQPPDTAWGLIIADGRSYMTTAWWIPTFAGLCIVLTVLGVNLLGDWLRDKYDPRLRQL